MPPRCSRRAHTRASISASHGLATPVALPAPTGAVSSSSGSLSSSGTVPSTAGVHWGRGGRGRAVVVPSALWIETTPPPADDFVPSRDGILTLIRDKLQALQSQLIPESPPLPVPSIAGGPQSGELPFYLSCHECLSSAQRFSFVFVASVPC